MIDVKPAPAPFVQMGDEERQLKVIAEVQRWPRRIGKNEYLAYLRGEYLSPKKRILAECYRCNNGYVDGAFDCQNYGCPLHKLMPYRGIYPKSDEETTPGRNCTEGEV